MSPPAGNAVGGGGPSAPERVDRGIMPKPSGQGSSRDETSPVMRGRDQGASRHARDFESRQRAPPGHQTTLRGDA